MKKVNMLLLLALYHIDAFAFCGFYVAKADAKLFNKSSQVIIARNDDQTTITMSSDFNGDVKDFAMVIPVPVVLRREQIKTVNRSLFDKLDAYSGPRLVEYYDSNPCSVREELLESKSVSASMATTESVKQKLSKDEDADVVKIEARYTVGEYDILLLSSTESAGLEKWLTTNGYKVPPGAAEVLTPYIKSNMKFFVVKVNIDILNSSGAQLLNPLQVTFNSPKFMLPIRLGMANATHSQDMIVYTLTKSGRVETTNYRTTEIPSNKNVPEFVKDVFGKFYVDLYKNAVHREGRGTIFCEYAWNLSGNNNVKCDPCPTPPPIISELQRAGVDWLHHNDWGNYSGDLFITRLHVTYDRQHFPQDLVFQETPNRENFQARYIITHPAQGDVSCTEGKTYVAELKKRRYKELLTLANLTNWDTEEFYDYPTRWRSFKLQMDEGFIPIQKATETNPVHRLKASNQTQHNDSIVRDQTTTTITAVQHDALTMDCENNFTPKYQQSKAGTDGDNSRSYLLAVIFIWLVWKLFKWFKGI